MKCMQLNLFKNVTRMTKTGGGVRTDKICRQYLDALGMSHG